MNTPNNMIASIFADELVKIIEARTGLKREDLQCPREKTSMTPCIARDGGSACSDDGHCVGCGANVMELLTIERLKQNSC